MGRKPTAEVVPDQPKVGMANPAAVYCADMGYEFQIINTPSGQDGICSFENSESCKAWHFLEGKCGQSHSYCAKQGYDIKTLSDGKNAFSRDYAICVSKETGREIDQVTTLTKLQEKSVKVKNSIDQEQAKNSQENLPKKLAHFFKNLYKDQTLTKTPETYPSSFDWRNYNGQNWVTSVKDQGNCGSCWAFSAVGVSEAMYNIRYADPGMDLDLSEQYLVSDCHSYGGYQNCCGGWKDVALEYIRNDGIPDEDCMSYIDGAGCSCSYSCDAACTYRDDPQCSDRTCSNRCSDWQSRLTQIDSTDYVNGTYRSTIQHALIAHGPLAVSFGYGSSYHGAFDGNGIYRCTHDTGTNHAVTLVGYNDTGGYWIIKNSWGVSWNGDGYMKIGYGECFIEQSVYYAEVVAPNEKKLIIQNSLGTNIATLSDLGNIVLNGICTQNSDCSASNPSFIIQNSSGETVGYIDVYGNLCLETGDCSGMSTDCNSPSGGAFIIKDSIGVTKIYLDQTGDLCLTGMLVQNGIP